MPGCSLDNDKKRIICYKKADFLSISGRSLALTLPVSINFFSDPIFLILLTAIYFAVGQLNNRDQNPVG